jgi:hypothetical protein
VLVLYLDSSANFAIGPRTVSCSSRPPMFNVVIKQRVLAALTARDPNVRPFSKRCHSFCLYKDFVGPPRDRNLIVENGASWLKLLLFSPVLQVSSLFRSITIDELITKVTRSLEFGTVRSQSKADKITEQLKRQYPDTELSFEIVEESLLKVHSITSSATYLRILPNILNLHCKTDYCITQTASAYRHSLFKNS